MKCKKEDFVLAFGSILKKYPKKMDFLSSALSVSQLGDQNHWVLAMFLYLTVVDANRRASGRFVGSRLYDVAALTVMGFGGGIVNPVLLGHDGFFPFPMGNDLVLPTILAAYVFTGVVGATQLDVPGVRHVRLVAFELVRAKLIHGWCTKSAQIIPSSYFPQMAVFGVLLCGAIGGCGGLFLINGGISPIKDSVPWPVESAITASLVHFLVTNAFLVLPPVVVDALGENVNHAHLCIAVVLVFTRLIPAARAALPWRLVPLPGGAVTTPANQELKEKSTRNGSKKRD